MNFIDTMSKIGFSVVIVEEDGFHLIRRIPSFHEIEWVNMYYGGRIE